MIHHACDICGTMMTPDTTPNGGANHGRIEGIYRGVRPLGVEIITSIDGVANGGDVCRDCVFDAVASLDPRKLNVP